MGASKLVNVITIPHWFHLGLGRKLRLEPSPVTYLGAPLLGGVLHIGSSITLQAAVDISPSAYRALSALSVP